MRWQHGSALLLRAARSRSMTTGELGLAWDRTKYPELWERAGRKVTLAGDVVSGKNWLGLQYFWVRYICE